MNNKTEITWFSLLAFTFASFSCFANEELLDIYIAGHILEKEQVYNRGISNAVITVTHKGKWLYDLRTSDTGWFESSRVLKLPPNQELYLTILKPQYEILTKKILVREGKNYLDITLHSMFTTKKSNEINQSMPTESFHGFVSTDGDASVKILQGAHVSLVVNNKEVAVSYTRDSGYFTINYDTKFIGTKGVLRVQKFSYKSTEYQILISPTLSLQDVKLVYREPIKWAVGFRSSLTLVEKNEEIENYLGVAFTLEYYPYTTIPNEYSKPTKLRSFSQSNVFVTAGLGVGFPDRKKPKKPGGSLNTRNLEYTFGAGYRVTDILSLQISFSLLEENDTWVKGFNLGLAFPLKFF